MRRIVEYCDQLTRRAIHNDFISYGDHVYEARTCNKELRVIFDTPEIGTDDQPTGRTIQYLQCGHRRVIEDSIWSSRPAAQRNLLWEKLLPFQRTAVDQAEQSNFNCYFNYEMGLGKTPIGASILRENLDRLLPCLIICEAGDIYRWRSELIKWLGLSQRTNGKTELTTEEMMELMSLTPQILTKDTTKAKISQITITSWTNISDDKFMRMLGHQQYKCIIADEAHMFKNEDAVRSQGFIKMCSFIPHRIFLSGTWIENALREAFVPLNILDPHYFNSRGALESFCIQSARGQALSLNPHRREYFFKRISRYVFRLTKAEAGIRLPDLLSYSNGKKEPMWINPYEFKSNMEFIEEYNATLLDLERELEEKRPSYGNIMGFMSQLRHHTGKMKVMGSAQLISLRMMELEPDQKLCIGVHHKSVMAWLKQLLEGLGHKILTISDENAEEKDKIEAEFKKPENRILIASILGAGKGRNLQFCQNAIILERQWNKSKEMQFEQRFHRIKVDANDKIISKFTPEDDVHIEYIMARDSFDEYFDYLVNLKGQICESADLSIEDAPDPGFVWELARLVVSKRMRYVGM